jgi:hypothetical protein
LDKILKVDLPVDTQREGVNTNTEEKSSNQAVQASPLKSIRGKSLLMSYF